MRTRPLVKLGVSLALASVVGLPRAAPAQDEDSAGPVLRVTFTEGKPVHLREGRRVEEIVETGALSMVRETVVVRDMTLQPVEVIDGGDWKVEWTFDRVLGSMESPLVSDTFDTSREQTGEPRLLIEPLTAIAGSTLLVTISPRGVVKDVAGASVALDAATKRYGEEADAYRAVLRDVFDTARLRQDLQFVLRAAPLPERAVTEEAEWAIDAAFAGPVGVTWRLTEQIRSDGGYGDIAEFEASGAGAAAVDRERAGAIGLLLCDESPDAYFVSSSYAVAKSDGLPLATFTSFWVTASAEEEDGSTGTYRMRAKCNVERIFEEELPGVRRSTRVPRVELISSWHPRHFTERLEWAQAKARTHARSGALRAAREELSTARELAVRLRAGELDDEVRDTDGGPGVWLVSWVGVSQELAYLEQDAGRWEAAVATWDEIAEHPAVTRAIDEGNEWLAWSRVHARVMAAESLAESGDAAAAIARYATVSPDVLVARESAPEDDDLCRLHVRLLWGWAESLHATGEPAAALAKGKAALALDDSRATRAGRERGEVQLLVDRLWSLSVYALESGDARGAASLLDRARREAQTIGTDEYVQWIRAQITQRHDDCMVIAADGDPADAEQSLRVAYLLMSMGRHADAHARFRAALADESLRNDWDEHNLYNAACNAALAHAAATGDEKASFAEAAIAWLEPQIARLRTLAESDDDQVRSNAIDFLEWAREGDTDLASLRETPEFRALFE